MAVWNRAERQPQFPQQFPSRPSPRRTLEHQQPRDSLSTPLSLSSWAAGAAANPCMCLGPPWGGLGFGCGSCAQSAQGEESGEPHFSSVPLNTAATVSQTDLVPTALRCDPGARPGPSGSADPLHGAAG